MCVMPIYPNMTSVEVVLFLECPSLPQSPHTPYVKKMQFYIPLLFPKRTNITLWIFYGPIWCYMQISNLYAPTTVSWYSSLSLYKNLSKSYNSPLYRFSSSRCMKNISLRQYALSVIYYEMKLVRYFPSGCGLQIICYTPFVGIFFNLVMNLYSQSF